MYSWRGKIGIVVPPGDTSNDFPEHAAVLPEGIKMVMSTVGIGMMIDEEIEKAFAKYPEVIKYLGTQECDVIVVSGALPFLYMGWDRSQQMIQELRETIAIPIILDLEATIDALRVLSAKKIVMATPFEEARNEERKKMLESAGFRVLNMKGLGIRRRLDVQKQPPYASYRLAKQTYLEAPEADAIYIACPDWPTVHNIEKLEVDVGRPEVTHVTA